MEILLLVAAWYAAGLIGSAITLEFLFRRNRETPLDITVGDIMVGAATAIVGPLNIVVGVVFLVGWLVAGTIDTNKTIIPARRAH